MKAPVYRVGQLVNIIGCTLEECLDNDLFVQGKIMLPYEDGRYLVRFIKTDGYAIVDECSISTYPEYDSEKPYDRSRIRIVFFGNGHFALPTLKMLIGQGYDVVAVVTMEDKTCGRGNKLMQSPVKTFAESKGLLVYQPRNLKSEQFLQDIQNLNPTLGLVVEYRKLPVELFSIPKWGTINLHSSLLPMYRGASTITSAIKAGETLTGVTTFFINSGIDKGKIINNFAVGIDDGESAEDIHLKLRTVGSVMVDDAIQRIAHSCSCVPQSELICDFIKPSHAPKLYRKDAYVPWLSSAVDVYNFIRAHSSVLGGKHYPYTPAIAGTVPTAWTSLKMIGSDSVTDVKIHKASKTGLPRGHHAPGEWFWQDGSLMVACYDELLSVDILQLPGKKRMTAKEYHNGFRGVFKGFCNLTGTSDSNEEMTIEQ